MPGNAERARVEIEALARAGLDILSFGQAAMDVLTRAVPFAAACLAPADPATGLITGNLKWGGVGDEYDDQWIFHEYEGPDPFNFQVVTGRPGGVATAMVETDGDLERSERFTDLYHHWDIGDEARIALQTDGATWGFLALFRDGPRSAFTGAEQAYLSGVRGALGVGLRAGDARVGRPRAAAGAARPGRAGRRQRRRGRARQRERHRGVGEPDR